MTAKQLIEKLEKHPDYRICIQGQYLEDVSKVREVQDNVYGETYKMFVLET